MDAIVPLLIILPILGMGAGITVAILRVVGRQRQVELLQRERIAALERGVDPDKLPTLRTLGLEDPGTGAADSGTRLAQNLQVIGVICIALGAGLSFVFRVTEDDGQAWTLGVLPIAVGLGMLVASARVTTRPKPPANE